jgi:integrase
METNANSPMERRTKPQPVATVERGNVALDIYPTTNTVNGKEYPQFRFTYISGSQRIRRRFSDLEEAKREAALVATKLANNEAEVLKLTGTERVDYVKAMQKLREWRLDADLNDAVKDYVSAVKRLPLDTTLREVVDFYFRRNPATLPQKAVREVVDELIAVKVKAENSEVYLEDVESRLGRFADAMQMNIGQVTGPMIERHLDTFVSPRTKRNHLRLITTLFKFAVKRKYLSKDALDELTGIELPKAKDGEVLIFSPDELREILTTARPELLPWIAIAAFSGLRAAELQRLDWSEVNLTEKHVEVPASKAKTASRRLAPLPDNAVAWLRPYVKSEGRVTGFENMAKQIGWLVQDVNKARQARAEQEGKEPKSAPKFSWRRNGLRHSFVSYRVAEIKDVEQVALEAGNSPTMVFQNYRKVVSEAEAVKWFAIVPPAEETNVIPMPTAAVAQS